MGKENYKYLSAHIKGIIIGKHGEMLKKIGTMARGDIENIPLQIEKQ